jgi:hypothetical protein
MPHFGIHNVRVSVRSAAPVIEPFDRPDEIRLAARNRPADAATRIGFRLENAGKGSLGIFDPASGRLLRTLLRGELLSPTARKSRNGSSPSRWYQADFGIFASGRELARADVF